MKLWIDDKTEKNQKFDYHAFSLEEAIAYIETGTINLVSFDSDMPDEDFPSFFDWMLKVAKSREINRFKWEIHDKRNQENMNIINKNMANIVKYW